MYRLLNILTSETALWALVIVLYVVFLVVLHHIMLNKNKNLKIWRFLCIVPTIICIAHFIKFNFHSMVEYTFRLFGMMYIVSIFVLLLQFLYKKVRLYKIFSTLIVIFSIFAYGLTCFNIRISENIHNLSYCSYTESFIKTIDILKNEYVLNEYKGIDYEYLYNKYYPSIEKAEEKNDEQLYFKTMFEFSKEFYDGHFSLDINIGKNDDSFEKNKFLLDYCNQDYGFGSILLSDGRVAAALVDKDSPAYEKGLRDGMIITKKNNIDVNELIDKVITPETNYPVLEDERLIKSTLLFATGDDTIDVSFINENDEEITINVNSYNLSEEEIFENPRYGKILSKILYSDTFYDTFDAQENLNTKMLNNNTGYIYIANEVYDRVKASFGYLVDDSSYLTKVVDTKLQDLKDQGMENLIIDLRANQGGYFTESEAIASLFTNDTYLVSKDAKYKSNRYDYTYLRGIGKYSDLNVTVLVDLNTVSSGDGLVYMLSKCDNVKVTGITNSNNSFQSIGGEIYLTNGSCCIYYPIYGSYDENGDIMIDTDTTRQANVKVDEKIELTQENIVDIMNKSDDYDYPLNYVLNKYY